jgi:hypothetical protein
MQKITSPQPIPRTHSRKRQTAHVALWLSLSERDELIRLAKSEGLSVSRTGRAIVVAGLRQRLRLEREVLSQPVLEAAIDRKMNRLDWLLVRIAFDVGQIRGLATNILGRQQGVNEEILKTILQESSKAAKMSITRRTPQLTELMEMLEQWIHEHEEGRGEGWQS